MDIAAIEWTLQGRPAVIDGALAELPGAYLPVVVPLAALPPTARCAWLLGRSDVPLDVRVAAALDAGLEATAWRLASGNAQPLAAVGRLPALLADWAAARCAALDLQVFSDRILVVMPPGTPRHDVQRLEIDASGALDDVQELLAALPWPRWEGPLLVLSGRLAAHDPAPGLDAVDRPALPVLRIPAALGPLTVREYISQHLTRLALHLTGEPSTGWPPWLSIGSEQVVMARSRGEGPSPRRMRALRAAAGAAALRALLHDAHPDPRLAMSLCAPLLHTRWRQNYANLLDALRHGVEAEAALRLAYQFDLDRLVSGP
jgi:hypothetical protein